jgi:hypothetical protein
LRIMCRQLDWQVASAVQILDTLFPVLSGVEELTLSYAGVTHNRPSASQDEVDRTQWRKLFTPFSNVKKLCVPDSLSEGLSHSLRSEDGEMPLELLPKLMDLLHLDGNGVHNVFTPFIDERHAAGHPVHLVSQGGPQDFTLNDPFREFIDFAAFDDVPTPDLVLGSSTNPSPESTSDQDHPHMGHAGPPQFSHPKACDTYGLERNPWSMGEFEET